MIIKKVIINNKPVDNVEKQVLKKSKNLKPQSLKGVNERINDIKGAYFVDNKEKILGKNVLLFDDIYTTGATANECKNVLLNAGASQVGILTLARD